MSGLILVAGGFSSEKNPCLHGADIGWEEGGLEKLVMWGWNLRVTSRRLLLFKNSGS